MYNKHAWFALTGTSVCLLLNSAKKNFSLGLLCCLKKKKKEYVETSHVVESAFKGSGAEHEQNSHIRQ